ncbi:hypothetical protein ES708_13613 [subsurface metagenome]
MQRVKGAVVGRGVGQVGIGQVVNGGAKAEGGGQHVNAFGRFARSYHLTAQQLAVGFFRHQLYQNLFALGIVGGMFVAGDKGGYYVVAGGLRLRLAEADPPHIIFKDLGDGRAEHAGEGLITAGDIGADDPAVFVGGRAQRRQYLLPGDQMDVLHTVPAGVDLGVAGLEGRVDGDASGGADFKPGVLSQSGVGPDADGQQRQVG